MDILGQPCPFFGYLDLVNDIYTTCCGAGYSGSTNQNHGRVAFLAFYASRNELTQNQSKRTSISFPSGFVQTPAGPWPDRQASRQRIVSPLSVRSTGEAEFFM